MSAASTFWNTVDAQLDELATARTADDVLRVLAPQRCPLEEDVIAGDAQGFFAGSGGERSVLDALHAADWKTIWAEASYYYVAQAPDGSTVTYIEGDIYIGDRRPVTTP